MAEEDPSIIIGTTTMVHRDRMACNPTTSLFQRRGEERWILEYRRGEKHGVLITAISREIPAVKQIGR